jgi:hypothetical protein
MSYSFKFVRTINGKTTEEKYPDNQSAHCAMGQYAGQHNLNVHCVLGRFLATAKSVLYKGNDPLMGVVGYVCLDIAGGNISGRAQENKSITKIEKKPKPKIRRKKRSS